MTGYSQFELDAMFKAEREKKRLAKIERKRAEKKAKKIGKNGLKNKRLS